MKYFLIGHHSSGKREVIKYLENLGVKYGKNFTNADITNNKVYNYKEYEIYTNKDINDIFENKAYVFMQEHQDSNLKNTYKYQEGLSLYNFENNDVFLISPNQLLSFNNPSIQEPVCFVWLDNTKQNRYSRYKTEKRNYDFANRESIEKEDINEFVKYLYSFPNSNILYFSNEEPSRVATIIYTLIKHPELYELYIENFN